MVRPGNPGETSTSTDTATASTPTTAAAVRRASTTPVLASLRPTRRAAFVSRGREQIADTSTSAHRGCKICEGKACASNAPADIIHDVLVDAVLFESTAITEEGDAIVFELKERRAIVTGGGSGIGEATAMALAARGARVFVGDRDEVNGQRVAAAIVDAGGSAAFVSLDVTDEASCAAVADRVLAEGAIDILVNNAGIGHVGTIVTTAGADLDRMYAVNVRGVFNMSRACIASMLERRSGAVVNMASIGGIVGIRDRLAYCTTKFAVVGLTKSMALDHATDGIRVNCICAGRVETPFVKARLREYADPEAAYREMAATQAVGRMGRPDEIAAATVYLASDEAAFITGSAFIIDGGWTAGK